MPPELTLTVTSFSEQAETLQAIRTEVFHHEQGIDLALDLDGHDPAAQHLLASWQDQPVGTARIRRLGDRTTAKIERLAVLKPFRHRGIGRAMITQALTVLSYHGVNTVVLHAQIQMAGFYQQLGFVKQGEPFTEAGILHIKMHKPLTPL